MEIRPVFPDVVSGGESITCRYRLLLTLLVVGSDSIFVIFCYMTKSLLFIGSLWRAGIEEMAR